MVNVGILILLGLVMGAQVNSEGDNGLDLRMLSGEWEGEGEVIIPKTPIPISIEGKAVFTYDTLTSRLRTSLEASRFFFNYSDSGYLSHDPATDSITWEVWDGFGKYCLYKGKIEDNVITGTQDREGWYDRITIDFFNSDSLSFRLTSVYQNGKVRERATIDMWRVK